ncbi:hemin uptake protein HemP [Luteimonas deserti]|uniref:Hemin uptake protein HemP n=1 Tax=Luteimonas deserti TaxID=2752306 RepID=A0A7Z0TVP6_9GAMM|nr:hemin uptake protein HemP [Luteimonas deserti]NYZ62479.1 hemin uptake protein HemP [Luteimonas deserti]
MFHVSQLSDVPTSSHASATHDRGGRFATPPALVELDSADLLGGRREVLIRHGNETYRLRHTRNDKLILTK